jgi:hypothetical protein
MVDFLLSARGATILNGLSFYSSGTELRNGIKSRKAHVRPSAEAQEVIAGF